MTVRRSLILVAVVLTAACGRGDLTTGAGSPDLLISDALHDDGNEHFFWLPPMVGQPGSFNGPFDAMQSPVLRICDLTDCSGLVIAEYSMTTGPGSETIRLSAADEHYIVNWHTSDFDVSPGPTYRIVVSTNGTLLGYADVQLGATGKEVKNITTNETIGLLDGRTLPIKFRIEEGAVGPTATFFDAAADFDASLDGENPNGVWRYGESAGLLAPVTLFPDLLQPATGVNCNAENMWLTAGSHVGFTPSVAKSIAPCADGNVAFGSGQLLLHGGPPDRYAHIVFTAPQAASCTVVASFIARQNNVASDVHVLVVGASIYSDVVAGGPGTTKAFAGEVTLNVGDDVHFVVGLGTPTQSLHPGNVELQAEIDCSGAPLPTGVIEVTKNADAPGSFDFAGDLGGFTLNVTGPSTAQLFGGLSPTQTYDIQETPNPGFTLQSVGCTLESGSPTGSAGATGISDVIVQPGKSTTCVFTNEAIPAPSLAYGIDGNTLKRIDLSTTTVTGTFVKAGFQAFGLAVRPGSGHVYVSGRLSLTGQAVVLLISAATMTQVQEIDLGYSGFPGHIAVAPGGGFAYVVDGSASRVTRLDLTTNTVAATIPGGDPIRVAVTPDGTRALVAHQFSGHVSVINTSTNAEIAQIGGFSTARGVAITPDGGRAYVTDASAPASTLRIIDLTTLSLVGAVTVGRFSRGVAVSPDGASVFVADQASPNPGTVSVVETVGNTVAQTIAGFTNPTQLAFSNDGSLVYVVNDGTASIAIIDVATGTLVTMVPIDVDEIVIDP